jgi:hypothetical protein
MVILPAFVCNLSALCVDKNTLLNSNKDAADLNCSHFFGLGSLTESQSKVFFLLLKVVVESGYGVPADRG